MKMFKNKTALIIGGIVIVVVVAIGAYFFVSGNSNSQATQDQAVNDNQVQSIAPSVIGFKLEAAPDKKKIRFTIAKASDIKEIEYELTYEANSTAQEQSEGSDATVQRGITGQSNISSGSSSYQSSWLILGSQSANVVRYDTGVKGISITVKITKNDNKVYQVQDKLSL